MTPKLITVVGEPVHSSCSFSLPIIFSFCSISWMTTLVFRCQSSVPHSKRIVFTLIFMDTMNELVRSIFTNIDDGFNRLIDTGAKLKNVRQDGPFTFCPSYRLSFHPSFLSCLQHA